MTRPSPRSAVVLLLALSGALAVAAPPALADGADAGTSADAGTETAAAPAPVVAATDDAAADLGDGAGARPVLVPTETPDAIGEHWRERMDDLAARDLKRASAEEREIERVQETLGLDDLFGVATLLVREAHQKLDDGSADDALADCEEAVRLAPHFAEAHLCVARASLRARPQEPGRVLTALSDAFGATVDDVRNRRIALADELLILLFGVMIAGAALVVLLIARYATLFFHDFHHLFPKGVSKVQTTAIGLVLVLLPMLFGLGLVGSVAVAAVAIALFLSRGETIVAAVAFLVLASSQLAMTQVVREGAFGVAAQDVYLVERGDAPAASVARLRERAAAKQAGYATWFALGRYDKRIGRLKDAETELQAAIAIRRTAAALNDLGNVVFLEHREEEAAKLYDEARALGPTLAEPPYNLATYDFRHGELDKGNDEKRAAVELGGERLRSRLKVQEDFRANLYLVDVPLADADIEAVAAKEGEHLPSVGGRAFEIVSGSAGGLPAMLVAALAALFVALAPLVRKRLRPSSKCEKCGRAVCPRCDPELGSTQGMCGQCISVFVRRSGVDAPDRIRKELEVRRFRRRQRLLVRFAGLVWGGGGHVLAGRIGGGALFLVLFSLVASRLVFWHGLLHGPFALDESSSTVGVVGFALVFALVYLGSLRHLFKHEEAD